MDNSPQEAKEQGSKLLSLLREATDKNRIHQETVSSVSLARKGLFKLLRLAPNRKDGYNPADAKAAHRFLSVIVSQTHYADKLQRAEQFVEYAFNQRPTVEVSDENGPIATGTLEYVDTEAAVLAIAAKTDDGQIESFTIPYAEDMPVPEGLRSHQDHFGMKALVSLAVTSTLGK